MSDLLTIKEAADYLRMNPLTVYRLASKGKVPATKVGRHWRIHRGALEAWLRPNYPHREHYVLVVDDEAAVRLLFERSVEEDDCEIALDLRMSGINGVDTPPLE